MAVPAPTPHRFNTVRRRLPGRWYYAAVCDCGWHFRALTFDQAREAGRAHRRAYLDRSRYGAKIPTKSEGPALSGGPLAPRTTFLGGPGGSRQRKA